MTLENQVVIVSGGSRGLGNAVVESLLRSGATVATTSRSNSEQLERLQSEFKNKLTWKAVDAADSKAVQEFVLEVASLHGSVDALVNNAAVGAHGVFAMNRPDEVKQVVDVNLIGTLSLTQACVRQMLVGRRGAIVNVSSIMGLRGDSGAALYGATKAAIDGLTRHLARELGPSGIRVNGVAPGYFESEMSKTLKDRHLDGIVRRTPLRRLASIAEIVEPIRFLLSERAAFVTGQTLMVDGGWSV